MNLSRTILVLLLFSYSSYSQIELKDVERNSSNATIELKGVARNSSNTTIELKGVVRNSSNVAIEFANVVLTNQKNEIVKGTITNESGRFSLSVKGGGYKLSISFLGYKDWLKEISIDNGYDFGVIILEESKDNLDEVVVTAKKPVIKRKIDRIEFNVNNTILSEGNAWEVLNKTPGVIASSLGALQVFGKSGVLVMIDERPVQLSLDELKNMLEGMSASEINLIEVITNPPAKYDAEGNAIINISLKRKKTAGYNGEVFSRYTQGIFPKLSNGANIVYRNNKVNISANYSLGKGKSNVKENSDINFLNSTTNTTSFWKENSDRNTEYTTHNFRTLLDYQLSEKSVLGIKIDGNLVPRRETINKTRTDVFDDQKDLESFFINNNNSDSDTENISYNVNFNQKFKRKGRSLAFNFDYIDYETKGEQGVNTDFYKPDNSFDRNEYFISDNEQNIDIYTSKLDYIEPIDSTSNLETGFKFNSIKTDNNLIYFNRDAQGNLVFDSTRSNQFIYDENTYAAYLSYDKDFDRFSVKVGLRGEYTKTKGNSVTLNQITNNNYFELFPSAFFQYKLKNKNSLGISYSRRIKRPKFKLLNPFQFFTSPYSSIEGSPFLQPSFSDNIDITYSLKNKYFLTGYFSYTKNPFTQLSIQDNETRVFKYKAVNLNSNVALGLVFSTSFNVFSFWGVYFDMNLYNEIYEFIDIDGSQLIRNQRFNIDPYLWNEFQVSREHNLSLELTARYFSPKVQGGFDIKEMGEVSIGVKKKLFKNKATLSMYIVDVFDTNKYTLESKYAMQNHIFRENPENQYVRFSLSYRFGNSKNKKKAKKERKSEEKKRL
ncbi:outer membrane beta-barrel protein [Tenacibaculum caenipelagi]|uniref:Outer membrane receptor protein involved in Fe transport n=1 Tax=Tenacibaculum caenipelagi TaxID=1325435 RepID=A0A4R6TEH8_9FLAO|nr:outer membrane beta-barrel protein [Tenacibaculum caenipelagi]TDQ25452.1 outer membrane receptor protein involved in Fe transport [Tenacibaculum caenipelagi]